MSDAGGLGTAWLVSGLALLLVGALTDVEVLSPVLVLAGVAVVVVTAIRLLQGRRGPD